MRKTPLTLGVLSIIFGALVACYSAFNLAFASMSASFMGSFSQLAASAPRRPGEPDPSVLFARLGEVMKQIQPYLTALTAGKLLFSLALVAIGIGMYKRQRWARTGAIAWAALALVFLAGEIMVNVGIIQPHMNKVMQDMFASMPNGAPAQAMMKAMGGAQSGIAIVGGLLFWAPFPVVLLALCGRRSAAGDFVD
jgi:hypothetical protein